MELWVDMANTEISYDGMYCTNSLATPTDIFRRERKPFFPFLIGEHNARRLSSDTFNLSL